jgi:16S rRNA (guanine(966)-N(2))-methyltransferase RsmD
VTRIVAGTLGGRRLAAPAGEQTRPTSERVREALFSTIGSMTELDGCRFADLYAGSGAVGIEAASRGAAAVLLVESEARAARTLRQNIENLALAGVCQVSTARVASVLATPPREPFDVVFADPPYRLDDDEIEMMLSGLVRQEWLAADGVVVVERSARSAQPRFPEGVTPERGRRYGDTALWYGRRL